MTNYNYAGESLGKSIKRLEQEKRSVVTLRAAMVGSALAVLYGSVFAIGYKGYTGYLVQPGSPDPFIGSTIVGYAKIKDLVDVDPNRLGPIICC